ncbi:myb-related transcription factor, partner of profilin-like [Lissotriton helveticus]
MQCRNSLMTSQPGSSSDCLHLQHRTTPSGSWKSVLRQSRPVWRAMESQKAQEEMALEKRKRKQKFSEKEQEVLIEEMVCNHEDLFGKKALKVPDSRKRKIWLEIQEKVNSVGVTTRSTDEIKKRWYDLRLRSKERLADRIKEANKTGGGTSAVDQPTPHEELIESTLLPECVSGVATIDSSEPLSNYTRTDKRIQARKFY